MLLLALVKVVEAQGADATAALVEAPPRVSLPCGVVQGVLEPGGRVEAFRGIPYGAAPTGSQRWKPSVAAPCWSSKVLDATKERAKCLQYELPDRAPQPNQHEDCLHLNVFRPAAPNSAAAPLPVLFWIHGGMNTVGVRHARLSNRVECAPRRFAASADAG